MNKVVLVGMLSLTVLFTGFFVFKTWNVNALNADANVVSVATNTVQKTKGFNLNVTDSSKKIHNIALNTDNVVLLFGQVGENAIGIANQITAKSNNNKPIYLLIDSPGGSIIEGAMIINAMEASKVPVHTVCMQICASMAAVIHQYGKERLMLDRSILMFHDAAGGFQGYFPHIKAQFEAVQKYILRFDLFIANRIGMKVEELEALQHKNIWIDSEDAVSLNYADKLVYLNIKGDSSLDLTQLLNQAKKNNTNKNSSVYNFVW